MKELQSRNLLVSFICWFSFFYVSGQVSVNKEIKRNSFFHFKAHPMQKHGFDELEYNQWKEGYPSFKERNGTNHGVSYKSVNYRKTDYVLFSFTGKKAKEIQSLRFLGGTTEIPATVFDDSTFSLELPAKESDFIVKAVINEEIVGKLFVRVFKEIREKIIIVPIIPFNYSIQEIENNINSIYKQANIQFKVILEKSFKSKVFESETVFSTPNKDHIEYTGQMRLLRDLYFEANPKTDKNAHYIFVIQGFKDSLLNGYMSRNKSLCFTKLNPNLELFSNQVAQFLGYGVGGLKDTWINNGPLKGTTHNLMDSLNGMHLTHFQWTSLRVTPNYYSYYDNSENVKTNNGTIAYYFWEEDEKGNIIFQNHRFFQSIKRPYKHNYLSYRFKVKYIVLRPIYKIGDYYLSILDLIFASLTFLVIWYIRKKIKKFWEKKKWRYNFLRRAIFFLIISFTAIKVYENYWVTNKILNYFKQVSGPLQELGKLDYAQAKKELMKNDQLLHEEVPNVCSEILIRKKKSWSLKKRAKVLYFDLRKRGEGVTVHARFIGNSDSLNLTTINYHKIAHGHYIVLNFKNKNGILENQKVYDYFGNEISTKLQNENPAKRILVMVNGYRPTSLGQTFEENFSDIQNNGLEYPNSKNFIYNFDRYDYWQPWNEINLLFQKRINPNDTYYADGHFSVSTSNYRTLINFTNTSSMYPKKCNDRMRHTCYTINNPTIRQFLFSHSKTINQLKMHPNVNGFNLRKSKGRIAGKNLLQVINENPEFSKNDTVFIVAHSMGFAYSQGMIEVLRGKINFGGYYIIAAENGQSGIINKQEWQEVWQYGSNFNSKFPDAPCLQDGIAPQYKVSGLPDENQIFIPKRLYPYKGYFNSHFIGFYTWVLDIEKEKPGYISQR